MYYAHMLVPVMSIISLSLCYPLVESTGAHGLLEARAAEKPKEFYLKTQVVKGSSDKNNLYVKSYHTGAGLSDAVLDSGKTNAAKAYLNATNLQFDFGTDFPWGFVNIGASNYAGWEDMQINAGFGNPGYYFNATEGKGLLWNAAYPYENPGPDNEFDGWFACDWYHGVPQLFWIVKGGVLGKNANLISTCSKVVLIKENI